MNTDRLNEIRARFDKATLFLSSATSDIPGLLAEVDRLQAANAELAAACEAVDEYLSAIPCDPGVLLRIRKALARAKGE